jgi:hypothetical protein
MKRKTASRCLAAIFILSVFAGTALPDDKAAGAKASKTKVANEQKLTSKEPIDTIWDFLEDNLDRSIDYEIQLYSNPQSARFGHKKAVVLRVIYKVSNQQGGADTKDQLFLVQDGQVKQWIDYVVWAAEQQRIQQEMVAQELLAQQQMMAALSQPQMMALSQPQMTTGSGYPAGRCST